MIVEDFTITPEIIEEYRSVFDNQKTKPEIEERLFQTQNAWLLDKTNKQKEADFIRIIDDYSKSAVLNLCSGTEGIASWQIDGIVTETTRRFLKIYTRFQNHVIGTSFWGVLIHKAREARSEFLRNEKHNKISVDQEVSKRAAEALGHKATLLDLLSKKEYKLHENDNDDFQAEQIAQRLQAAEDYLYCNATYDEMLMAYKAIIYTFEKLRTSSERTKRELSFYKLLDNLQKTIVAITKDCAEDYLKNRKIEMLALNFLKILKDGSLENANESKS